MIEVKLPDGSVAEFPDGTSPDTIKQALARFRSPEGPKTTNLVGQVGTGTNEGIAALAGMPVDAVAGAINAGSGLLGSDFRIENPVGGSASIGKMLSPFMTADEPDTATEKFARGLGYELGAAAIPGGVAASKAGVVKTAIAEIIAALTGQTAATTTEALGGGETAQDVARLVGNLAGGGVVAVRKPRAPSTDELLQQGGQAIDDAIAGGTTVAPRTTADMASAARTTLADEGLIKPSGKIQKGYTGARDVMSTLDDYGVSNSGMTPKQAQNVRRQIMDVATTGGSEGRIGSMLVDEFDNRIIDQHVPGLKGANKVYAQGKRAEIVDQLIDRAGRQASRTGTRGNTVNAIRQRADALLSRIEDGKEHGFTPEEIKALRGIVDGNIATDALRLGGFLAPSTGKLQAAISAGGAAYSGMNPFVLAAITGSEASKRGAEYLTKRQARQLSELIRNGAPLRRQYTDAERAIIAAIAAGQAPQSVPAQ